MDNCKTRRETLKLWDLVRLILETWRYVLSFNHQTTGDSSGYSAMLVNTVAADALVENTKPSVSAIFSQHLWSHSCLMNTIGRNQPVDSNTPYKNEREEDFRVDVKQLQWNGKFVLPTSSPPLEVLTRLPLVPHICGSGFGQHWFR